MKEAFELIHDKLDELAEEARNFEPNTLVVSLGKMGSFMCEVEAEYTKNIMDELLEAKKNCGEDSDCSQCVFGCEDGCRLQEIQTTGGNNGWIDVKDRLPEKDGYYLTCDHKGNIHVFFHSPEYMEIDYAFGICEHHSQYYQPIAWMELPNPYTGKKGV